MAVSNWAWQELEQSSSSFLASELSVPVFLCHQLNMIPVKLLSWQTCVSLSNLRACVQGVQKNFRDFVNNFKNISIKMTFVYINSIDIGPK